MFFLANWRLTKVTSFCTNLWRHSRLTAWAFCLLTSATSRPYAHDISIWAELSDTMTYRPQENHNKNWYHPTVQIYCTIQLYIARLWFFRNYCAGGALTRTGVCYLNIHHFPLIRLYIHLFEAKSAVYFILSKSMTLFEVIKGLEISQDVLKIYANNAILEEFSNTQFLQIFGYKKL